MRAILWKEFRENLKWAVLWMLGVSAAMAYVLHGMISPYTEIYQLSLRSGDFPAITLLGAVLGAALLGLLQSIPERRRDQWAFLVHRPISPTAIFFGKVIAGLTLYAAALLLPLLGASLWMSMPGHVAAPFSWGQVLPGVADVLAGVSFYFAGMLVGLREARWLGSRALPFVAAIGCAGAVMLVPEFGWAVLVAVFCGAVLMAAACGSFAFSGQYRPQPTRGKFVLGAVLLAGLTGVGLFVAVVGSTLLGAPRQTWNRYFIEKDGRVLRVKLSEYGLTILAATDLAGNAVTTYDGTSLYDIRRKAFLPTSSLCWERDPRWRPGYRTSDRFLCPMNYTGPIYWYYVPHERLVLGYDLQTRRCVGAIGPDGFRSDPAAAGQRFPDDRRMAVNSSETPTLSFWSGAYLVDLHTREARLLVEGTSQQPVLGAAEITPADWNFNAPNRRVGVAGAGGIHLFSDVSRPPLSVASHYPLEKFPNVEAGIMADGTYVIWYQSSTIYNPLWQRVGHVVMVSADGAELRRYDLPPIVEIEPSPAWPHVLWALLVPIATLGVVAGCIGYLWVVYGYPVAATFWRTMWTELFVDHGAFYVAACVVMLVGAVGWAVTMVWIARRYGFTRRQAKWWTAAGLVLGPVGVLLLIALREWPARLACGACGQMRLVDRQRCGHCAAEWAPPAPTGTEIFDQTRDVVAADR